MDEVRQSLEPKISHVLADYQTYKETHDALLQIPFIKRLLENQCKCHATQAVQSTPPEAAVQDEPIHLEIIDGAAHGLPNLDSIAEYINSTIDETVEAVSEAEDEEEELELFEVEIKGKTYVTNDEIEGDIYEYVNDEVGEIVGTFKNGVARLAKKSKSAKK